MINKKYSLLLPLLLVGCVSSPAYNVVKGIYTYDDETYENLINTGDACFDNVSKMKKEYNEAAILLIDKNEKESEFIQVDTPTGTEFIFQKIKNKNIFPFEELEVAEKIKLEHPTLGVSSLFAYLNYACDRNNDTNRTRVVKFDMNIVHGCAIENMPDLFRYQKYPATEKEINQRRLLMQCFKAKGL